MLAADWAAEWEKAGAVVERMAANTVAAATDLVVAVATVLEAVAAVAAQPGVVTKVVAMA